MIQSKNENNLPCPRFEFNWRKADGCDGWMIRVCDYMLVIPIHKLDIRSEYGKFSEWKVLIGQTESESFCATSKPFNDEGYVDLPFRDGAHVSFDNEALFNGEIPVFAVCEHRVRKIEF